MHTAHAIWRQGVAASEAMSRALQANAALWASTVTATARLGLILPVTVLARLGDATSRGGDTIAPRAGSPDARQTPRPATAGPATIPVADDIRADAAVAPSPARTPSAAPDKAAPHAPSADGPRLPPDVAGKAAAPGRVSGAEADATPAAETGPSAGSSQAPDAGPDVAAARAPGAGGAGKVAADDLKRIIGIGPKLEARLNANGIDRFAQVAAMKDADLDALEAEIPGFARRARAGDWVMQAQMLLQE